MLRDLTDNPCLMILLLWSLCLSLTHVLAQEISAQLAPEVTPVLPEDSVLITSDSCDWFGSGLDAGDGRVVVPIYLRCLQGSIKWRYPQHGLRILLSHPDREFRACVRIRRSRSPDLNTPNVRVALEEERGHSLRSLFHPRDGLHADRLRCFSSRRKQAVLFVEAIPSHHSPSLGATPTSHQNDNLFELDYHLEPVESDKVLNDPMDECRPCTDQQLIQSFCASDFLVRGKIRSLVENELLDRTEIVVDIESVIRDTGLQSLAGLSGGAEKSLVLHRPLKCQSRATSDSSEFLLMGHWMLGNPVIRCAPKFATWKHVRHRALQSGSSPCRL